jgi:sirohydrochlorin ferrochelatase
MTALLIISHGSRRDASNEEVFSLRDRLAKSLPLVECGFLEITGPTVQEAIDRLAELGAVDVGVLPHFLAAGTHVTNDIPRELEVARQRHPKLHFYPLPHLGSLPGIPSLILDLVSEK